MRFYMDNDRAFEAFQFHWIALTHAQWTVASIERAACLHTLMQKLAAVSTATPGNGRVLSRECMIELSDEERVLLLDAMAHTSWRREVFPQVRRACEFLGAEFEEAARA